MMQTAQALPLSGNLVRAIMRLDDSNAEGPDQTEDRRVPAARRAGLH